MNIASRWLSLQEYDHQMFGGKITLQHSIKFVLLIIKHGFRAIF
jgi:hypothetical protein